MVRSKPQIGGSSGPVAQPSKRIVKSIPKTADLLKQNENAKSKGKGKEKEVLGGLSGLMDGGLQMQSRGKVMTTVATRSLPSAVMIDKLVETRALEILAFRNAMASAAAQGNTRIFQSLPRHLRRRAASHNPRRVPKRMRRKAAAEIDPGDNIAKLHRKRAKLKAKGNLHGQSRTAQLLTRQRDKFWLSTHIFHAKRFHMANLWGYRLALTPTFKSFRSSYRAARRRAIVHDASYFGVIELGGAREALLSVLGRITGGGRFAGEKFESGGRMGHTIVYQLDTFPLSMIGPVEVIWQPWAICDGRPVSDDRKIWLRVHPSIFTESWTVLKFAISSLGDSDHAGPSEVSKHGICMRDLRQELEAFEITGPKAGKALKRIFKLCKLQNDSTISFYQALAAIDDPAEIPVDLIAGLMVHDPRLHFPPPKLANALDHASNDGVLRTSIRFPTSSDLAGSSLWDAESRQARPRYTKSDLDHRRNKLEMPGSRLRPTALDDRIPILVVRRSVCGPPAPSEGLHGFTVLFPHGWSMPILQSLIYSQCQVGGLHERRVQYREAGLPSFPEHWSGVCVAGEKWETAQADEEERRWSRKPPGKRSEWESLGTTSPFRPDWNSVLPVDSPDTQQVGLNRQQITSDDSTEECLANGTPLQAKRTPWLIADPLDRYDYSRGDAPAGQLLAIINQFRSRRCMRVLPESSADDLFGTALLHARLRLLGRGSPSDLAIIYGLAEDERNEWLAAQSEDPTTAIGSLDPFDKEGGALLELGVRRPDQGMIIGYVTTGNFSLSRGTGHALVTITLRGHLELLGLAKNGPAEAQHQALVKVRNRDGRVCRLASVELLRDPDLG